MAINKGDGNLILAVVMTMACVVMLIVVIFSVLQEMKDWRLIALYAATCGFFLSVALNFYIKWRHNEE